MPSSPVDELMRVATAPVPQSATAVSLEGVQDALEEKQAQLAVAMDLLAKLHDALRGLGIR